jgi:hypothetical protein
MVGKTDFDYFTTEHATPAFEDDQEIIRTGRPIADKIERVTRKDGHVGWVITSKMPLRNDAGEIIGTFGVSKDITAIKEAEAKLEEVHRELLIASREAGMSEVATSVLHNVGNVLNSVNVSTSLVKQKVQLSKIASVARAGALLREHETDSRRAPGRRTEGNPRRTGVAGPKRRPCERDRGNATELWTVHRSQRNAARGRSRRGRPANER